MRRLVLILALVPAGCGSANPGIDDARARGHIQMLAGTIGRRPVGSAADARAAEYVATELTGAGFRVRRQETDISDARSGVTTHVVNILGWRDGAKPDAIALTSHYDSVPDGPGASDDALGVATCLEAGRALVAAGLEHSLLVLVTDGEEVGLRGARAAITDPEVRSRVRAFLNFDGTGAAGPAFLFEAGPGRGAPLDAWARAAEAPLGASFGYEIFRRLPNDTDFTVLKTLDADGLNFAPVGDSYGYHTDRDRPERVQDITIHQELANTVSTVRALDRMPFAADAGTPTYFDVAERRGVVYGPETTKWIAIAAGAAGAAIWLLLGLEAWRARRWAGLLLTPIASLVSAVVAAAASIGAAWLMRAIRGELAPWYASPGRFCIFFIAAGIAGRWAVTRGVAALPDRWQPWRSPLAVWWVALPIWIGVLVVLQTQAPAASFMLAWPLIVAALLLVGVRRSSGAARFASSIVLIVAALFWMENIARLVSFVVPLFGWMGSAPPLWILPALLAAGGLMIAPPLIAVFSRRDPARGSLGAVAVAVVLMLAITGGLAWYAPEYTPDRPERRAVRFVQDDIVREAWWEVTASEARLGLPAPGGPAGAQWTGAIGALQASARIGPPPGTFLFRSTAAPRGDVAAGTASATWSRAAAGLFDVEVTIASRAAAVALVLPPGVEPLASSLAGQTRAGRWTATFIAPPSSLVVRLRLAVDPQDTLSHTAVILTTSGIPEAPGGALPAWLQIPAATWNARTVAIIPVRLP